MHQRRRLPFYTKTTNKSHPVGGLQKTDLCGRKGPKIHDKGAPNTGRGVKSKRWKTDKGGHVTQQAPLRGHDVSSLTKARTAESGRPSIPRDEKLVSMPNKKMANNCTRGRGQKIERLGPRGGLEAVIEKGGTAHSQVKNRTERSKKIVMRGSERGETKVFAGQMPRNSMAIPSEGTTPSVRGGAKNPRKKRK